MGLRFSHIRPAGLLTVSVLLFALGGCTADRYLMVPKDNVDDVRTSVKAQRATLVTMEENATVRHEKLLAEEARSTESILQAIATQVEKPSCPPPEVKSECPTEADKGRADRRDGKVIVGQVERFYLAGPGLVYKARIDSGAETSSIYGRNIEQFERDGNNWVRFEVPVPGTEDDWVTMEKEISRTVKIIQASSDDSEKRAVVKLQFAIGDHQQVAEFTLADRGNLTYDVLVGRNILRDVMLIDVGREYATELPSSYTENDDRGDDE